MADFISVVLRGAVQIMKKFADNRTGRPGHPGHFQSKRLFLPGQIFFADIQAFLCA
jgi:hypothetical protein